MKEYADRRDTFLLALLYAILFSQNFFLSLTIPATFASKEKHFSNDIRYKREKSFFFFFLFFFFSRSVSPFKSAYKKIRIAYFCLENNILLIKIGKGQLSKLQIFLM